MSIQSAVCAEYHNKELKIWKEKFRACKTIEEFREVLSDFEKLEFSE